MTDSLNDAKRVAFKLLGYRGRSEAELRERLSKKGFSKEIISRTIDDLRQAGYLDDREVALNLIRQLFETRMFGHEGAKRFMIRRGLPEEVIDSVLEYDEDRELRNAQKILDKKAHSMGNYLSESGKRKLWNHLARKGYSSGIINKILKGLRMSEEDG